MRSLQERGGTAALNAVVRKDREAGASRDRGGGAWLHQHHPGELQDHLPELDARPVRLVHLTAALVGASDSRVALQRLRASHGLAGDAGEVCALWEEQHRPGSGRSGYVVFVGIAAVHGFWLAREDERFGSFLSHVTAD